MTMASFFPQWRTVGTVPIARLPDARLQLHWAVQIVASFGNAMLEKRADDSQSNLGWVPESYALGGHPSAEGFRVGLRLADLTLLCWDSNQTVLSEIGLSGKTLQQGLNWLATIYSQHSRSTPQNPFALPEYNMPTHAVGQQGSFTLNNPVAFQEFHYWYANANMAIDRVSSSWKEASPIRCWPHYFDIATLVPLDLGHNSEAKGSVGCGMSPGDASYAEPYLYVTVWPYPDKQKLSPLGVGCWRTENWVGAILTASALIESGSPETQAERVSQFFEESTQVAFAALGAHPS